jgi:ABC-type phosphate/phosphonate transport system, permease component
MIDSEDRVIKKPQLPSSPNIKLHETSLSRIMILLVFVSLLVITGFTLTHLDTANVRLNEAVKELSVTLHQMFLQPNAGSDGLGELLQGLGTSLLISIMTTIIGAVFGFFFAVLASKNLTNIYLGTTIRVIMAVIRAIPTIIWAMIFSIVCGLGSTAAILGLSFHSIAYLTKAYSESIEGIDESTIESLKVTGSKFWVIVFQAIWPTIMASFVSWTFIRLEINFANAIACWCSRWCWRNWLSIVRCQWYEF